MYYYLLHDKKDLIQIYFRDKLVGKSLDLFYPGIPTIKQILSSNIYLLDDDYKDFLVFDIASDYSYLDLKQYYKLFKNAANYHVAYDVPKVRLLSLNVDAKEGDRTLKECENFLYIARGKEVLLLETDLSPNIEIAKNKIANKEKLEDKDLFSLIFYPLTFKNVKDEKINEVINIVKDIDSPTRTFVIAGLVLICKSYYENDTFTKMKNYLHKDDEFLEYRDKYYVQVAFDEDDDDEDLLQKSICAQFRTPYNILEDKKPNFSHLNND